MGSSQNQIQVSYDVDNDFFRLWLDERMNYTCALFEGTNNLEEAQSRKLAWLHDAAHVRTDGAVLDIGCGWGAQLEYLATNRGVRDVHGITLSPAQHVEIQRRGLPNVTASCVSYLDYQPPVKFDSIISICMMEHICSAEEARVGKAIDIYRNYFHLAHQWSNPGAWFGLQTILRDRLPRIPKDIRDLGWLTATIFPGSYLPRLEEIIAAATPYWEVVEVKTRRLDYKRTCEHWRDRLRHHEQHIREHWGGELFEVYDRYLTICIHGFEQQYQSLAQYSLRRVGS